MSEKSRHLPQLPASCLADYIVSGAKSPESRLRPYKFRQRGEGRVRTTYYAPAISAIRQYHKHNGDKSILDAVIAELTKAATETAKKGLCLCIHSSKSGPRLCSY